MPERLRRLFSGFIVYGITVSLLYCTSSVYSGVRVLYFTVITVLRTGTARGFAFVPVFCAISLYFYIHPPGYSTIYTT